MATLISVLKSIRGDQKIKVGTVGGSRYIYCGTAQHFMESLSKYEEETYSYAVQRMRASEAALSNLITKDVSAGAFIAQEFGREPPESPTLDMYLRFLDGRFRAVKSARSRLERRKKYLDEYTALRRRGATLSESDPVAEPDGALRVIITGDEVGRYWTIDEATGAGGQQPFALGSSFDPEGGGKE